MKFRWDKKYLYWGITIFLVAVAILLFYFGIFHMSTLTGFLKKLYGIVTPLVYGAVIAYILNPLLRFLELQIIFPLFEKLHIEVTTRIRKIVRMICVLMVICIMFLVIYGLIAMLVPELVGSITNITNSFPRYIKQVQTWISDLFKNNQELEMYSMDILNTLISKAELWLNNEFLPQLNEIVLNFSTGIFDILKFLKNFLLGAIISIYMLYGKETFVANGKKALYAIKENAESVNDTIRDIQFLDKMFGGFIIGKIIDSVIIGIICYIGMSLLNLPYTLLISVIIGVTNVIPFFGPFIGAIPAGFLILLINPLQCLYFVLFVLALQQFDGNFLGPKILGDSTGLSSFMVIVAILIGGGIFGVFGMFVGVPITAVICTVARNAINRKLEQKHYPVSIDTYRGIDHLDPKTYKPVYKEDINTENEKTTFEPFAILKRKQDARKKEEEKHETGNSAGDGGKS